MLSDDIGGNEKMREAAKSSLTDEIARLLESLDTPMRPVWRTDMPMMEISELQRLKEELQEPTITKELGKSAVNNAITFSKHARQAAERRKCDDLDGGSAAKIGDIFS
jgi:hypothetical protein